MSTAEVEQPNLVAESSHRQIHRLATDGVELTGFRPAPRRTSLTAIMNTDDNSGVERYTRRNRRGQSSLSISMGDGPPVTLAESNPIVVMDDTGAGGTRTNRRATNGAQNRPILVLDSDEEQDQLSEHGNSSFRRSHGVRRGAPSSSFRIFSPPPPSPQRYPVPPVPFLPPPIIAESVPFTILPPPVNNNPLRNRLPFDQPAHSVDNNNVHGSNNPGNGIQLGGGLLSQGDGSGRRHAPRAQVRFQPRPESFNELFEESDDRPRFERASRIFGRFFASYFSGNPFLSRQSNQNQTNSSRGRSRVIAGGINSHQVHQVHQNVDFFGWGGGGGGGGGNAPHPHAQFFGLAAISSMGPWGRRDVALGLGPDYDRRMTHPERAGPGWTYDFGTEQEEGRSKLDGSEILVCAKCLDPLLANADGMVDVSEEEKKGRRVWGLRCGHILDGKCVGILMRPEEERDLSKTDINPEDNSKGKERGNVLGKEEPVDLEYTDDNVVDGLATSLDVKGKGKASAVPTRAPPPLDNKETMPPFPLTTESGKKFFPEDSSIRSRLRSRRSTVVPSSSTASSSPRRSARHPATPYRRGGPSSTRRRGTKRKHTNAVTEFVEERYEWICPVSGCGRVHVSVKVAGLWKMDLENGAVGIFV